MGQSDSNVDAALALSAAVAQIELAVREVQPSVEALGALIQGMTEGLSTLQQAMLMQANAPSIRASTAELDTTFASLEAEVNGSIVQLQFYDRLVQHLSHVQSYLSGVAGQLSAGSSVADAEIWETLRNKLRGRLITEAQRQLLDAMLPPADGVEFNAQQARDENASQGSIELF
jgi:hypothetical protein